MQTQNEPMPLADWFERAWMRRYLSGGLDAEERDRWEAYLLDKPHLVDDLEEDNELRDGLGRELIADTRPGAEQGNVASLRRFRLGLPCLAALSTALVALVWVTLAWTQSHFDEDDVLIANPPRLVLQDSSQALEVGQLYPGDPGSTHILVELLLPPGASEAQITLPDTPSTPLISGLDGVVRFLVPLRHTSAQLDYRLDAGTVSRRIPLGDRSLKLSVSPARIKQDTSG